jgi:AcrR family transcriptional regulator
MPPSSTLLAAFPLAGTVVTSFTAQQVDGETPGFLSSPEMVPTADTDRYPTSPPEGVEARVVGAALRCIARWGMAKTTADDIAREAGMSRATLYRAFPGGRDVVLGAVLRHEVGRFFAAVSSELDRCESLEDLLVTGLVDANAFLDGHEALRYLIAHEPERILPGASLDRLARIVALAAAFAEPHLARFLPGEHAGLAAEVVTRLTVSLALIPSARADLGDPASVRHLVTSILLPGLGALDHTCR